MPKIFKYFIVTLAMVSISILVSGCSSRHGEEPFFSGTKLLMVCQRPYSDTSDCFQLNVQNAGDGAMVIYFDNGGSIELEDVYCTQTIYEEDMCQGKDDGGNAWDMLNTGSKI